jgi:hypothetical protein
LREDGKCDSQNRHNEQNSRSNQPSLHNESPLHVGLASYHARNTFNLGWVSPALSELGMTEQAGQSTMLVISGVKFACGRFEMRTGSRRIKTDDIPSLVDRLLAGVRVGTTNGLAQTPPGNSLTDF